MSETPTDLTILAPIVQYIFAGLCVVLLGILFYFLRRLMNDRDNHFATLQMQLRGLGTQVAAVETMAEAVNMKADAIQRKMESLPCDQHSDLLSEVRDKLTALSKE